MAWGSWQMLTNPFYSDKKFDPITQEINGLLPINDLIKRVSENIPSTNDQIKQTTESLESTNDLIKRVAKSANS